MLDVRWLGAELPVPEQPLSAVIESELCLKNIINYFYFIFLEEHAGAVWLSNPSKTIFSLFICHNHIIVHLGNEVTNTSLKNLLVGVSRARPTSVICEAAVVRDVVGKIQPARPSISREGTG